MPHSSATFHQLNLLLVYAHYSSVRVGVAVKTYNETVAKRSHLMVVSYSCHRTSGRNYISEMVEKVEHFLRRHRVLILVLNSCNLVCNTPVHVFGRLFIYVSEAVLHRILVYPHSCRKLISVEILKGLAESLIV